MAQVQIAIGVWGPIVQYEFGLAAVLLTDALIKLESLPFFEHDRLSLGQVGLHGELGIWQI